MRKRKLEHIIEKTFELHAIGEDGHTYRWLQEVYKKKYGRYYSVKSKGLNTSTHTYIYERGK